MSKNDEAHSSVSSEDSDESPPDEAPRVRLLQQQALVAKVVAHTEMERLDPDEEPPRSNFASASPAAGFDIPRAGGFY